MCTMRNILFFNLFIFKRLIRELVAEIVQEFPYTLHRTSPNVNILYNVKLKTYPNFHKKKLYFKRLAIKRILWIWDVLVSQYLVKRVFVFLEREVNKARKNQGQRDEMKRWHNWIVDVKLLYSEARRGP